MSTKKLDKVLRAARNGDVVRILDARDALQELAVLRRAAAVILKDKNDECVMQGELENAYALLAQIAEEP